MSIFQEILENRSFISIQYAIEDAMPSAADEDKTLLKAMLQTKELDEIYALAHEKLGNFAKANELREWMTNKSNKRSPMSEQMLTV